MDQRIATWTGVESSSTLGQIFPLVLVLQVAAYNIIRFSDYLKTTAFIEINLSLAGHRSMKS